MSMDTKICSKCGKEKPVLSFQSRKYERYRKPESRYPQCNQCVYKRRKDYDRSRRRRRTLATYNLTQSDYDTMLQAQDGTCFICQYPPRDGQYLKVDHNHETGRVRGLLCNACNLYLGRIKDNPKRLVEYLERDNSYN